MFEYNKYGSGYTPHMLFGRVVAVDPYYNTVKVRLRPPYDCFPDQWAKMIQLNSGSPLTPTAQVKQKISNEGRTGFWILPNVNDFVICAYLEGTAVEPNLVCFGAIQAPFEEKSIESVKFDDWVLHHPSESFFRLRGLDSVQKIIGRDSNASESAFAYNRESSRSEIEINNKEGSIIRLTQFTEGEILSDDEIYLRDTTESNPQSPLKQGRRKRNVDQDDADKEDLIKGRGMIQLLHNTGGFMEFRNLESSIEDDPRLEINLFHKNNFLKFKEEKLDKPYIGLQHYSGANLTFSDNESEGSSDIRSKIQLQHPVGSEFIIDEPTDGNTTISLTQSTSSTINFDSDGNIEIDATEPDKKITIKTAGSTEIIIENGTVTINASTKAIIDAPAIELGSSALESIVKGDTFKTLYNAHTHPTGVGPSGPPLVGCDASISTVVKSA